MKLSEMRQMDIAALNEKVAELKEELAKEKALIASGTRTEKPGKIRGVRKTIARILTVIKEKEKIEKNLFRKRGFSKAEMRPFQAKPENGKVHEKIEKKEKPKKEGVKTNG